MLVYIRGFLCCRTEKEKQIRRWHDDRRFRNGSFVRASRSRQDHNVGSCCFCAGKNCTARGDHGKVVGVSSNTNHWHKINHITKTVQSSLKKHVTSGGGTTEHIVYADHSGGHEGYRRNTFRSMGQYAADPPPYPYEASEELRDRDIRMADVLK